MCLRLNTSAGATSASIPVQRVTLFAGAATLASEPNVLITQFAAQTLSRNMIQFGFQSNQSSTPFKSINLVFTFPELSLPAVNFHWYDMTPGGQTYYVTGTDAGAPELWNWITGNPGEIIGFNVKVVSI